MVFILVKDKYFYSEIQSREKYFSYISIVFKKRMQENIGQSDQIALSNNSVFNKHKNSFISQFLQFSSSVSAVAGGVILSSNTPVSKYGFILLALSSSQIFISSSMTGNKGLMMYSASLFVFVDCLGIYRWLLH
ncbi:MULTISPECIES: hypothetical protein [Acaryochloris]|nr:MULTISPECIES: hypothetical protein [Acaryochloris]BDM80978.1 hypothetical protein AM10699_38450 [Acaryochloris marina MBIC10699]